MQKSLICHVGPNRRNVNLHKNVILEKKKKIMKTIWQEGNQKSTCKNQFFLMQLVQKAEDKCLNYAIL